MSVKYVTIVLFSYSASLSHQRNSAPEHFNSKCMVERGVTDLLCSLPDSEHRPAVHIANKKSKSSIFHLRSNSELIIPAFLRGDKLVLELRACARKYVILWTVLFNFGTILFKVTWRLLVNRPTPVSGMHFVLSNFIAILWEISYICNFSGNMRQKGPQWAHIDQVRGWKTYCNKWNKFGTVGWRTRSLLLRKTYWCVSQTVGRWGWPMGLG